MAFQTPLSEEAVREAYFLGQRHDESVTIPSVLRTSHGSQPRLVPRSYDFWRDFAVTVFDGDQPIEPSSQEGRPDYNCTKSSCFLIGATVLLDFAADAFESQDVTVQVEPPEGQQFVTGLDLSRLR